MCSRFSWPKRKEKKERTTPSQFRVHNRGNKKRTYVLFSFVCLFFLNSFCIFHTQITHSAVRTMLSFRCMFYLASNTHIYLLRIDQFVLLFCLMSLWDLLELELGRQCFSATESIIRCFGFACIFGFHDFVRLIKWSHSFECDSRNAIVVNVLFLYVDNGV